MFSDGVNCFSAVPAVSQCAPSGCNRNIVITVGIIVVVIGCAAGSCHSQQCGRLQEMRNASSVLLMRDCSRKGIWFVLLDRHVYLNVQTYIHSYLGSYIHKQFVLIAFWSLMFPNAVRVASMRECYATFLMVNSDLTGFTLPRSLSVPHGRSNQLEMK